MSHLGSTPHTPSRAHQDYCHAVSRKLFNDYHEKHGSNLVFATIHGSHLYGTYNKESDLDLYVVLENCSNKHKVNEDGYDITRFNLKKFLELVDQGSHQAVEALSSPYAVFNRDNHYYHMMRRLYPSAFNYLRKSLSAATSFKRSVTDDLVAQLSDNPFSNPELTPTHRKKLLHAARLENDAQTVLRSGFKSFTPVIL